MSNKPGTEISLFQTLVAVLWPSFLTASVATVILFTIFDPVEISSCISGPELTWTGAYTIGFFMFWLLTSSSCLLALYFNKPCHSLVRTKSDPA